MLEIAHEGLDAVSPWIGIGVILGLQLIALVAWLVNGRDDQKQLQKRQDELFQVTTNLTKQMEALTGTLSEFRRELAGMSIERRLDDAEDALKDHADRTQILENRANDITAAVRRLDPGWQPWRA